MTRTSWVCEKCGCKGFFLYDLKLTLYAAAQILLVAHRQASPNCQWVAEFTVKTERHVPVARKGVTA
jgi:predicted nucleic-acid-binding Zn-ribbon protein